MIFEAWTRRSTTCCLRTAQRCIRWSSSPTPRSRWRRTPSLTWSLPWLTMSDLFIRCPVSDPDKDDDYDDDWLWCSCSLRYRHWPWLRNGDNCRHMWWRRGLLIIGESLFWHIPCQDVPQQVGWAIFIKTHHHHESLQRPFWDQLCNGHVSSDEEGAVGCKGRFWGLRLLPCWRLLFCTGCAGLWWWLCYDDAGDDVA